MAEYEIPVITDADELTERVQAGLDQALLCKLGGSITRFSEALFPDTPNAEIYAQFNRREARGRGPHFDVYQNFIDSNSPVLGVFNLSGEADVATTSLPKELADSYAAMYPEPTDAAFEARRHFSLIAFHNPGADSYHGTLDKNTGLVLPQGEGVLPVVHDIVPLNPRMPGQYIKLVVPAKHDAAQLRMQDGGYEPFDEFLVHTEEDEPKPVSGPLQIPGISIVTGFFRTHDRNAEDDFRYTPVERNCNLD